MFSSERAPPEGISVVQTEQYASTSRRGIVGYLQYKAAQPLTCGNKDSFPPTQYVCFQFIVNWHLFPLILLPKKAVGLMNPFPSCR